MQAINLRRGMAIVDNGDVHMVLDFKHMTPGNKRGFVQIGLKNIKNGKIIQRKLSSTEEVEDAHLESRGVQYLYRDDTGWHFMDLENYHSFSVSETVIGAAKNYLKENMELDIQWHGEAPVVIKLPSVVALKVTESPPWVKGDSVSNNMKPVTLETGYALQVPIFIDEGTVIKVNTQTGEYIGRE